MSVSAPAPGAGSASDRAVARDGTLHASAVALGRRGVLILGPSGSGKTRLALELVALGAALVADDRVALAPSPAGVLMRAPEALAGLVEIRGAGVLAHPFQESALCLFAVRLAAPSGTRAGARLPEPRGLALVGREVALFDYAGGLYPAGLLAMLRAGRVAGDAPCPASRLDA